VKRTQCLLGYSKDVNGKFIAEDKNKNEVSFGEG
jgi:hypothetical protein